MTFASDDGTQLIEMLLFFRTLWVVLIVNGVRRFGSRLCSIVGLNLKNHPPPDRELVVLRGPPD